MVQPLWADSAQKALFLSNGLHLNVSFLPRFSGIRTVRLNIIGRVPSWPFHCK